MSADNGSPEVSKPAASRDQAADQSLKNDMLATMTRVGLPYVIHEYLHDHWSPMYFARVAWELSEGDLHFAGCVPVHLNFRDAAVPEALSEALFGGPGLPELGAADPGALRRLGRQVHRGTRPADQDAVQLRQLSAA